jgi:translocation and assembly module TamA
MDADTNLVSEFRLAREHPDAYESLDASVRVGVVRVFTPALSGAAAIATKFSRTEDAFGEKDFLLVSLPIEAIYDTRDKAMDPKRGVSLLASIMPAVETIGGAAFNKAEFRAASYRAIDEDGRAVLAGRVSVGSIAGADLSDVPASTRFFGGGGGSVRGFAYRSLGPSVGGQVVGGLSYVGASAELRLRITDSFGIVPFVDAASITDSAWPTFSGDVFVGAGIGLRYYTALGPLRIDVAMPVTERDGQSNVAVYVGLGQAF